MFRTVRLAQCAPRRDHHIRSSMVTLADIDVATTGWSQIGPPKVHGLGVSVLSRESCHGSGCYGYTSGRKRYIAGQLYLSSQAGGYRCALLI